MLIIEDGSIVPNANSYVTIDEVKDYASLRGFKYPDNTNLGMNIILACEYLQSKCYIGELVSPSTQPLKWPRDDVYINGELIANNVIPNDIKKAQIEAALAQAEQSLLSQGGDFGDNIKKEKTDMLETEYFEGGKSSAFNSERVNLYLQPVIARLGAVRI